MSSDKILAKYVEELCVADCSNMNSEMDPETNECRCMEGYAWNGYECRETHDEPSDPIPCESVENWDGTWGPINETEYECGCIEGYVWDAESLSCVNE